MKKWKILSDIKTISSENQIIEILLKNRSIEKKDQNFFFNPDIKKINLSSLKIDKMEVEKAKKRIKKAIKDNEKIVIFGDYDVDGVCGTAILWESIYSSYKNVFPYIPHRVNEGYGLTTKGIKNIIDLYPDLKLIITTDNGITAKEAISFAKKNNIDVIITDHHLKSSSKPLAYAVVHTQRICGAAVAWVLIKELKIISNESLEDKLELVALATVADMVSLTGVNRAFLIAGIIHLRKTKRIGLSELLKEAGIDTKNLGVYEIGHIISPRINAMGRLFHAMDSLRLLCTKDAEKARRYANSLAKTNKERQIMTDDFTLHAKSTFNYESLSKIVFVSDKKYNQGVIGLVASKLVDEYYRPSFVVSVGEKFSKGSARSIKGVNIIELIRSLDQLVLEAGGHPMAAGFTIETEKLEIFKKELEKKADKIITDEMLHRKLIIDMSLGLDMINISLYKKIQKLSPFGVGNAEPTFLSNSLFIDDIRFVGQDNRHVKLLLTNENQKIEAIAFGMGEFARNLSIGEKIDVVYSIDENLWNGNKKLQLKIKDIKKID